MYLMTVWTVCENVTTISYTQAQKLFIHITHKCAMIVTDIKKKDHTTRRFLQVALPVILGLLLWEQKEPCRTTLLSEKRGLFFIYPTSKKVTCKFSLSQAFPMPMDRKSRRRKPLEPPCPIIHHHHVKKIIIERKICSTVWIQNRRQIFFLSIPIKPEISFLFCVTWHA